MEKLNKILVTVGGVLYLIFGVFHLTFFRVFNDSNPDFSQLAPMLRKIVFMLNLGLVILFVLMGVIILLHRHEIFKSRLGKAILLMSAMFFVIRGTAEIAFPSFKLAFVITMFAVAIVYLIPVLYSKKKQISNN